MPTSVYVVTSESHKRPLVFNTIEDAAKWMIMLAKCYPHAENLNVTIRAAGRV